MGSNRRVNRGTAATCAIEDFRKAEGNRSSAEAGDDARDHLAQRIEMVSAFQGHGESALTEAGREGRAPGHEFDVSRGGQDDRRGRVAVEYVDAGTVPGTSRPGL